MGLIDSIDSDVLDDGDAAVSAERKKDRAAPPSFFAQNATRCCQNRDRRNVLSAIMCFSPSRRITNARASLSGLARGIAETGAARR